MATEEPILSDNQYDPDSQDFNSETRTWGDLFRIAIDQWVRENMNIWLPGRITKVINNSFVNVQPLIQERFKVQGLISLPELLNVPVEHPRGEDFWVKLPIAIGGLGRINFCDRSMDNWIVNGGGPLDPEDIRMHHISDASFTPGLYPKSKVIPGNAQDMILHNGSAEIYLQKGGTFKITNGVTELISTLAQMADTLSTASTIAGGPFTPDVVTELEEYANDFSNLEGS